MHICHKMVSSSMMWLGHKWTKGHKWYHPQAQHFSKENSAQIEMKWCVGIDEKPGYRMQGNSLEENIISATSDIKMKINIAKWLLSLFFKSSPFLSHCLLQEKTMLSFCLSFIIKSCLHLCPSQFLIILGDLFSYSISFNIFQCKIRFAFSAEGTDPVCALWLVNILQRVANLRLTIRTESRGHPGRKEWAEYSIVPPKKASSKQ